MCRKQKMRGVCLICFGLGILVGHGIESWLLCCCGSILLVALGFCIIQRR